jgi:hypothetical protein
VTIDEPLDLGIVGERGEEGPGNLQEREHEARRLKVF